MLEKVPDIFPTYSIEIGVPETFVIDKDGVIHYKHIGPLTPGGVGAEAVAAD